MTIFCPSSYEELQQMLCDAYDIVDGPVCIRWPKTPAPTVSATEVGSGVQARRIRAGSALPDGMSTVCLIGVGKMLAAATDAADLLAERGIDATVWDPRAAKPLDPTMLDDAARHDVVVTIEDGLAEGGIGSNIAKELSGRGPTVRVLGVPTDYVAHDNADVILARLGLDGSGVATTIASLLD